MIIARRSLIAALGALPAAAGAEEAPYPSRPIRMIVNFPPGGTTDIAARLYAERLQVRLHQPVPVENRSGATGNIGAEAVVRAVPDGYTVLSTAVSPAAINYTVFGPRMPYRPEDLAAVGLYLRVPNVIMVHPSQPIRTIGDLVAAARPGQLSYASTGIGSSPHMAMELFMLRTGTRMAHVPFRGAGPMLIEALAGRVPVAVDNIPSCIGHIRAGRLRALAVTGHLRSSVMPEVPTLAESALPGFEATAWFGMQVPAHTPAAVITRLGAEIDAISKEPLTRSKLAEFGAELPNLTADGGTTPATFDAFIQAEIAKWAEVVRASGVTLG